MIFEMTEATEEVHQAFQRLMPQLTKHSPPPDFSALAEMAASPMTFVFLARHPDAQGPLVGSATLGIFQTPTGQHAWIEDVVVDEDARRLGLGRALTAACLQKAQQLGLKSVNLTSRPAREAANQLYQSMGFQRRQTNIYRIKL